MCLCVSVVRVGVCVCVRCYQSLCSNYIYVQSVFRIALKSMFAVAAFEFVSLDELMTVRW